MNSNKFIPILGLLLLLILAIGSISASDMDSDSDILEDSSADIDLTSTEAVVNEVDDSNIVTEENADDAIDDVGAIEESDSDSIGSVDESSSGSIDSINDVEKDFVGVKNSNEDNILASTVNFKESDYSTYFNASGNIKSGKLNSGDTLDFSGQFTDKMFIIDIPLIITSTNENAQFTNCGFSFINGSSGSRISNLKMNNSVAGRSLISVSDANDIDLYNNNLFSSGKESHPMTFIRVNRMNIYENTLQTTGYIQGWGHPSAMVFRNSGSCNIHENTVITNDSNGIYFTGYGASSEMGSGGDAASYSNYIVNNTVYSIRTLPSSFVYAIQVMSSNNYIINNTVYNAFRGISTTGSNNQIIGNKISRIHGAYMSQSEEEEGGDFAITSGSKSLIKDNIISDCFFNGTRAAISAGKGSNITNNTIENLTGIGVYIDANNVNIIDNHINVSGYGIYLNPYANEISEIFIYNNLIDSNNLNNIKLMKLGRTKVPNNVIIKENILYNSGVVAIDIPSESQNISLIANLIIGGVDPSGGDGGEIHFINESNFYNYFTTTGYLENSIKENDTLVFSGELSSKNKLYINEKVKIIGRNAKFIDTTFIIGVSGVSIDNIQIYNPNHDVKDRLWGIQVNGVDNVTIKNCNISINDTFSAYAIYLLEASNCTIANNILEARGNYFTVAVLSFNSRDIFIDGNTIKTIGSGETYLINNKSCLDGYLNVCIDACLDGSVTCPDGYTICTDGSLLCPDGTIIPSNNFTVCVDGSIVCTDGTLICADGTTVYYDPSDVNDDGSVCVDGITYCLDGAIILSNGTKIVAGGYGITPDNFVICPDGTLIAYDESNINDEDGSICLDGIIICTDGSVCVDGTTYYMNGTVVYPDGTVTCIDGSGSSNVLDGVVPGSHMVSGVYRTYGVLLIHSSNITFTNNKVNVGSELPADYNLNESYNTIAGVFIHYGGFNNTISNNEIMLNANDPVMYGIGIIGASTNSSAEGSKYNDFINNNVTIIGPLHGVGIVLGYKAIESKFLNNSFRIFTNHSIDVLDYSGSENNIIEGDDFERKLKSKIIVTNSSYKLDNLNKIVTVTLKDEKGKAIANAYLEISVNGQKTTVKTNDKGVATLKVTLDSVKDYDVSVIYAGEDAYFDSLGFGKITVTKGTSNLISADKTYTVASTSKTITATLKDASGKLLKNKKIIATVDGKTYEAKTNLNGVATFKLSLNAAKTYTVYLKFAGDSSYLAGSKSIKVKVIKIKSKLSAAGKTFAIIKAKKLTATLRDSSGKALANKKLSATVGGKTVSAVTNAKGVATFKLSLNAAKTYTVSIKFAGDSSYAASAKSIKVKVIKTKTKLTAPKKAYKKSKKVKKLTATLKDQFGKAIKGKKVTFIVNKKKYIAKTNKKGVATVKVKLSIKKTYKFAVKFAGDKKYVAVKKTAKVIIK